MTSDSTLSPRRAGALAAGPALLVVLASGALAAPGYLDLVTDGLTRLIPVSVFDAILGSLGSLAKVLLGLAIAAGIVIVGALGGVAADRLRIVARWGAMPATGVAVACALGVGGVLVPLLTGAGPLALVTGSASLQLTALLASVAYGVLLMGLQPAVTEAVAPVGPAAAVGRRAFLGRALGVVGGGSLALSGAAFLVRLATTVSMPSFGAPLARRVLVDSFGVTPAVTPLADFYVVAKGTAAIPVDASTWRLSISGLVDRPAELSIGDVAAFPRVEAFRTIQCISNPVTEYGPYIGNQRWAGVRLRDVLESVGVQPSARWVLWRSADDFTESLPLEAALDERTWLVDEMGPAGTPLTAEHGFPLRVLIAGRYGMKQPKHLVSIVLSAEDEPGYWVQRGWDKDAVVRTYSRIDAPSSGETVMAGAPLAVYGVASAGDRGIDRVELSGDGGATWRDAELQPPGNGIDELTWVRWRATLPASAGGAGTSVTLVARATDGTGAVQETGSAPPLPSGATGYHRVVVSLG